MTMGAGSLSIFMSAFSILALGLNVVLLPLIAFKSGKEIGSYKFLLFFYTLIAVIHTVVTLIMVPMFEPSDKGWLFYATIQRVPQELGSWLICIFSICYIKLLMILTYSFVYRYFVMCRPELLRWFQSSRRVVLIVSFYFAIVLICAVPVCTYMRMNPEIAENLENSFVDLKATSYIGSPMFRDGHIVLETAAILITWSVAIYSSTGLIFFCIVEIIKGLMASKKHTEKNSKSSSIQKRLFILLILQTLAPLLFTFIPCLLSYALAYASIHAPFISQASSALMPLAQTIDPILIFGFIAEYRRALIRFILRRAGRDVLSSVGPASEKTHPSSQILA